LSIETKNETNPHMIFSEITGATRAFAHYYKIPLEEIYERMGLGV
jgi:hypothetical protein